MRYLGFAIALFVGVFLLNYAVISHAQTVKAERERDKPCQWMYEKARADALIADNALDPRLANNQVAYSVELSVMWSQMYMACRAGGE